MLLFYMFHISSFFTQVPASLKVPLQRKNLGLGGRTPESSLDWAKHTGVP